MTDNQNPSQEEPKRGVFSAIHGAHSKDLDEAEEPRGSTGTTEPTEPVEATGETVQADGEKPKGDERLGKALKRVAQLERQINSIGPWAQFGMAIGNDPRGKTFVERYQRGEALFMTQDDEQAVSDVEEQRAQRGEPPLTRQELAEFMDQREAAKHLADEINSMAEEDLPEFRKIRRNPRFAEFLDWARQSVWRGTTALDESVADWDNDYAAKEMTAVKKAYSMYLADNPKVREAAEKAKKRQEKERAAQAAAVPSSEGQTSSSQEEPAEKTSAQKSIEAMLNVKGRGKSFSTIGSKR